MNPTVSVIRRLFGDGMARLALDAREYKRGGNPKNPGEFSSGSGGGAVAEDTMNQIALIQKLFGSKAHDCAMDANAEWREEAHHRGKGGQFAKGSGGPSSSAPKKESKPKKAKAEGGATPAKPRPKANVSEQAHAAAKAKVAENAAKPKKPAKAKGEKPAPKEKAQPKPKKPTQEERVAKLGEQYTNAMSAKPSRRRDGAESPVAAPAAPKAETPAPKAATPNASWENYGKNGIRAKARASLLNQSSGKGWVAEEVDGSWTVHHNGSSEADEPKGHTQSHRAPSHEVIMGGGTHNKYSVREYGETVKAPDGTDKKFNTKAAAEKFVSGRKDTLKALSEGGKAEAPAPKKAPSPKAAAKPKPSSPKKYTGAKEKTDTEKQELQMRSDFSTIEAAANAVPQQLADAKGYSPDWRGLLQAVRNMKASPHLGAVGMESIRKASRGVKPVGAGEPAAAERNALLAALKKTKASKPKAPKKSTVAPNLGEAFKAKPSRRRGGPNPDHAS